MLLLFLFNGLLAAFLRVSGSLMILEAIILDVGGASTFITSAPISPSIIEQNGPGAILLRSTIFTPSNAPFVIKMIAPIYLQLINPQLLRDQ